MAYWAGSTPPPPKAPSLAPTTSEMSGPPPSPTEEKKKKKGIAKRVLKELTGGGGNNAGVKVKGQPTVRPYGRGGVGAKVVSPTSSAAAKSSTSLNSASPPSSIHQVQSQPPTTQPPPVPPHPSPDADDPRYDYYAGQPDFDDNQSTLSSIPAPKRTKQWIQQHAQLPSPPDSNGGPPSLIGYGSPRDYHSPPPSHYPPSSYSRGSSDPDAYYGQQYPGGYIPSASSRSQRLANLDEDASADFNDQFGRMNIGGQRPAHAMSSSPPSSRGMRVMPPSVSGSVSPGSYAARYYPQEDGYDERGRPVRMRAETGSSSQSSRGGSDPITAQVLEQYLAQRGIPAPASLLEQYAAQVRAQQAQLTQAQDLQSQIENLREAERKARERLEALRKDSGGVSGSSSRKDDSRLDVIGESSAAFRPTSGAETVSSIDTSASAAQIRNAIVVGARRDDSLNGAGRVLSSHERALLEKEKLRQRDMEREREAQRLQQQQQQAAASIDPLAALLAQQQQQQQQQHQQQQLLAQTLAAQQKMQAASAAGAMYPGLVPPAGGAEMNQQGLLMQLGALLLQQQQQLQLLRATASPVPSPGDAGIPPAPVASPPPGIDLNALIALQQNPGLAALLQQVGAHQNASQSPVARSRSPVPSSSDTAGTSSATNSAVNLTNSYPTSRPSPSPKPADADVHVTVVPVGRERSIPQRSSPPRVPLPDLPRLAQLLDNGDLEDHRGGSGASTPPPAYMSSNIASR